MKVRFLGGEDPLEKGMATHSNIPAWRFDRQRSLVGYSPQGHTESDMTEATQHTHTQPRNSDQWFASPSLNSFSSHDFLRQLWLLQRGTALVVREFSSELKSLSVCLLPNGSNPSWIERLNSLFYCSFEMHVSKFISFRTFLPQGKGPVFLEWSLRYVISASKNVLVILPNTPQIYALLETQIGKEHSPLKGTD